VKLGRNPLARVGFIGDGNLPSQKEHSAIARRLAHLFKVDPELSNIGSLLPDIDINPPLKHRKTLHNPIIPILLVKLDRSVALGYLSHVVADDFPLPMKLYQYFLKVLKGAEK